MVQRHSTKSYGLEIILPKDTDFGNRFYLHCHPPEKKTIGYSYRKNLTVIQGSFNNKNKGILAICRWHGYTQ